tara:strand:- start:2253 stop:2807 length:555 start_codon:yes stop_codon:yes gene_type:complete
MKTLNIKKILKIIGVLVLAFIGYIAYMILNPESPKETVKYNASFSEIEVVYSRPYKKGREIFGKLVPYGKYWRTGANAATTFESSKDILFNGQKLEGGKYRLYTVPSEKEWKVVLNSEGDTFFAVSEPDYSLDVLETIITVEKDSSNLVEQFTIKFSDIENSSETLMSLMWDDVSVNIPIGPIN